MQEPTLSSVSQPINPFMLFLRSALHHPTSDAGDAARAHARSTILP